MSIPDQLADRLFRRLQGRVYVDTATQGVPPAEAIDALTAAAGQWAQGRADWRTWEEDAEVCRSAVAGLLGCQVTDVALVHSVVHAAASVALQLPAGRIVVHDDEYRSNLLPWLAAANGGRKVTVVTGAPRTEALLGALDEDVVLVAVSSVQSIDGDRLALERLVPAVHAVGAHVFVDASQSLGALRLHPVELGIDFVAAAGYKWLLGMRGTGYFYVRPQLQASYRPLLAGPQAASDVKRGRYYGAPLRPFSDARRFDQSQAWLGWVASRPSVELLSGIGARFLEEHALGLAAHFLKGCAREGLGHLLAHSERSSHIAALRVLDPGGLRDLFGRHDIAAAIRPGGVRIGWHLYNDASHVDRVLELLAEYGAQARRRE